MALTSGNNVRTEGNVSGTSPLEPDTIKRTEPTIDEPNISQTVSDIGSTYSGVATQAEEDAANVTTANQPGFDSTGVSSNLSENTSIQGSGGTAVTEGGAVTEESLVQNQLANILSQDSALMMQAEAKGKAAASAAGVLGSTAGQRAAQGAVIDKAGEIAAADAATYAASDQIAQNAQVAQQQTLAEGIVAGELTQQEAAINQKNALLTQQYEAMIKSADNQTAAILTEQQGQWDAVKQEMTNQYNEWATRYQVSAEMQQSYLEQQSQLILNNQIALQEIMTSPELIELGGQAMANVGNIFTNITSSSADYLRNLAVTSQTDSNFNRAFNAFANAMNFSLTDEQVTPTYND